jgi:hypothetical protein
MGRITPSFRHLRINQWCAHRTLGGEISRLFVLCKWFHFITDLGMFTPTGKRPGAHCTGVGVSPRVGLDGCRKSRRGSENLAELLKISQNFRKSRRASENLAELPKISQNFQKSRTISCLLYSYIFSCYFLPDQYYIQHRRADRKFRPAIFLSSIHEDTVSPLQHHRITLSS